MQNGTLKVGTFNVQRGGYEDVIAAEAAEFVEEDKPDILLIQEATKTIVRRMAYIMGPDYNENFVMCESESAYRGLVDSLAVLWNSRSVQLQAHERTPLPSHNGIGMVERHIKKGREKPWQCQAQLARFSFRNRALAVCNVHLQDWAEDKHLADQAGTAVLALRRFSPQADVDIVGGDFNTARWPGNCFRSYDKTHGIMRDAGLRRIENIPVTAYMGTHYPVPHERWAPWQQRLAKSPWRVLRVPLKLDHLWGSVNMASMRSKTILHRGSDHLGVLAEVRL